AGRRRNRRRPRGRPCDAAAGTGRAGRRRPAAGSGRLRAAHEPAAGGLTANPDPGRRRTPRPGFVRPAVPGDVGNAGPRVVTHSPAGPPAGRSGRRATATRARAPCRAVDAVTASTGSRVSSSGSPPSWATLATASAEAGGGLDPLPDD